MNIYKKLFLLMILIPSLFLFCQENETDLEKMGLKGKVKTIKEKSHRFESDMFDEPDEKQKNYSTVTTYSQIGGVSSNKKILRHFNISGNLTEEFEYNDKNEIIKSIKYKYDKLNRKIEEDFRYPGIIASLSISGKKINGKKVFEKTERQYEAKEPGKIFYIYNEAGKLAKIKYQDDDSGFHGSFYEFDNSGHIEKVFIYGSWFKTYCKNIIMRDKNSNVIEDKKYTAKGNLISRKLYKYDSKNQKIEEKVLDEGGKFTYLSKMKYDNKGNIIEAMTTELKRERNSGDFFSDSPKKKKLKEVKLRVEMKYDRNNNLIEKSIYEAGGACTFRSEYKYDSFGNQVLEKKYFFNQNKTEEKKFDYIYDESGNWINKTGYFNGKIKEKTEREILYY